MLDGGEHLLAVAYVGHECCCLRTDLGDLASDRVDTVGQYVDQRDGGAVTREPQRYPPSDAAGGSGDERRLAFQWECHDSLPSLDRRVDEHLHLGARM